MDTTKLIDDVKVALRAAGFGNVTSRTSGPGTLLSADNGTEGATFYLTPDIRGKATAVPVAVGGRDPAASTAAAAIIPVVPNAAEMIAADPATAAQWLGLSVETARALASPAAR